MSPQLQLNQGPQDALLYDNTRSYFTNVGYVRTSNFQVEYKKVDSQNTAAFGSTVQFVVPKAADLLGPMDLRVQLPQITKDNCGWTIPASGCTIAEDTTMWTQWVDELGFAMIEHITFSVGSNDIERITGEQMQIRNELMTADEQRYGFEHVQKTGKPAMKYNHRHNYIQPNELPGDNEGQVYRLDSGKMATDPVDRVFSERKKINRDYSRIIAMGTARGNGKTRFEDLGMPPTNAIAKLQIDSASVAYGGGGYIPTRHVAEPTAPTDAATLLALYKDKTAPSLEPRQSSIYFSGTKEMIIPLSFFFTKHVSQYFPLVAVAGCNDIRISIKFRALKELVQICGHSSGVNGTATTVIPKIPNEASFKLGTPYLLCHYVHVTGPEAATLMNKEHVRLMKLWQHQSHLVEKTVSGSTATKIDINLSFLHPVSTLLVTIRRADDMSTEAEWTADTYGKGGPKNANSAQKGFFFYHGDGTCPNYDRGNVEEMTDLATATCKLDSIKLILNGQARHPDMSNGIDTKYLMHRLMPMLHSNSNQSDTQIVSNQSDDVGELWSGHGVANLDQPVNTVEPGLTPGWTDGRDQIQGAKNIFVFPFSLNPEGSNPSGAVNFSKVSHAKLELTMPASSQSIAASGLKTSATGGTSDTSTNGTSSNFRVDVYGLYYNWLQIKDGRALLSFA